MTVSDDAVERMFAGIVDRSERANIHVYRQDGKCVFEHPGRCLKVTEDNFAHAFLAFANAY